jgi:DNA polymerase-3 subunit delta
MTDNAPVVYLLHGEDEYAIARFVSELESRLGDPAMAAMNVTHLDGRTYHLEELPSVVNAMPFLSKRRLVVLTNPLASLNSPSARQIFLGQLEAIPRTTALVLIEHRMLTENKDRREGKIHWLEKWALAAGERVYLKAFPLPKGVMMSRWIQDQARRVGGKFTPQAADLLASLVGGNPRLADQEIHKLLAYINYQRPVDIDDVENLTPDAGQGDIFALVDSLGERNGRKAMRMLHRLLEEKEPSYIFGMVVRQFRLLLQTRELLDTGRRKEDIAGELKVPFFVADKLISQARHFSLSDLEMTYHHLLDLDEAVKTSQMPSDLALDNLVATLTSSQARP